MMPYEQKMKFKEFAELIIKSKDTEGAPVSYIQYQNSNFTMEFDKLKEDIDFDTMKFAAEAFNCQPEAINFWMGDHNSVSSLHKDHYENLYFVIRGEKRFTLLPPTDRPFLYQKKYHSGFYEPVIDDADSNEELEGMSIIDKMLRRKFKIANMSAEPTVPWMSVDPDNPDYEKFPLFAHASPIHCVVKPGEMLYLPSIFYHQVAQQEHDKDQVIAVNLWFDMQFDIKYNYFTLVDKLSQLIEDE